MMKYLKRRHDYFFDRIDESMLYFSPKFRDMLINISGEGDKNAEIANDLLSSEFTDVKPDMTFIDGSKNKPGYVTFIQINNADKKIKDQHKNADFVKGEMTVSNEADPQKVGRAEVDFLYRNDINNNNISTGVFTKSRNQVKIGKLINKIFPGKYNSKEIEDFVNRFKSKVDKGERFEIVDGADVVKYYDCKNYADGGGSLGSSCMRHESTLSYIAWYGENPDKVKLVVLFNAEDKVIGRALLWKVDNPFDVDGVKFDKIMDRIYYINDSDVNKFKDFAKENGWAYKGRQAMEEFYNFEFNGESVPGNIMDRTFYITMDNKAKGGYPYMDTFSFYDPDTKKLSNNEDYGEYVLHDTGGGYQDRGEWSEYYQETIPTDEAVYSDYERDWLWRDRSTWVESKGDWIPDDKVVYSNYHDTYLIKDDWGYNDDEAVWSEAHQDWLDIEKSCKVIVDEYGEEDWFPEDEEGNEFVLLDDRDEYYHIDICVQDPNGDWLLKEDAVEVKFSRNLDNYVQIKLANVMSEVWKFLNDEDIIDMDYFNSQETKFMDEYDCYTRIFVNDGSGNLNPYKWVNILREAKYNKSLESISNEISNILEKLEYYITKHWQLSKADRMKELRFGSTPQEVKDLMKRTLEDYLKSDELKNSFEKLETSFPSKAKGMDFKTLQQDIKILLLKVFPIYKGMTRKSNMSNSEKSDLLVHIFNTESNKNYDWDKVSTIVGLDAVASSRYEGDIQDFNSMVLYYDKLSKK